MAPGLLWLLLSALLLLSACFSASETALFSLSTTERERAGDATRRLLDDGRALLVAILLGNLVINVLFFAFAARLAAGGGARSELVWGLGALVALILFGEVFPKSLALRGRVALARVAGVPLLALVTLTRPVQRAADGVLEIAYRLIGSAGERELGITTDQLSQALEHSAKQGVLLDAEADILVGVAELQEIRVREIMTPRVDVAFVDLEEQDHGEVLAAAVAARTGWLVAVEGGPDQIAGTIRLRDALRSDGAALSGLVQPVEFIPEVASAFDLLHFLRERRAAEAVVIDEWGGTAGLVRLEDVFEEIVGELRVEGERDESPWKDLGDGRFLVVGSLSIRDWNESFGHRVVPTEFETVGGFVTALLERMPRPGDTARAGGLVFEVREVERHRITMLEIRVDAGGTVEGER